MPIGAARPRTAIVTHLRKAAVVLQRVRGDRHRSRRNRGKTEAQSHRKTCQRAHENLRVFLGEASIEIPPILAGQASPYALNRRLNDGNAMLSPMARRLPSIGAARSVRARPPDRRRYGKPDKRGGPAPRKPLGEGGAEQLALLLTSGVVARAPPKSRARRPGQSKGLLRIATTHPSRNGRARPRLDLGVEFRRCCAC